jgi:hypothetical protein
MALRPASGNLAGSRWHSDRWTKTKHCQTQINQKEFEAIGYPDDYHNEDWGYERLTGT